MARLSSQGAKFMMENLAGTAPTTAIASAATKAKPAVVTLADVTAYVPGDIIRITGSGFKSIDGLAFTVGTVTAGAKTVELLGSNTTAETGTWVATATASEPNMVETCLANFTRTQPAPAVIDVTTLCDAARKRVGGLADPGTFTFDGFYDSKDAGYIALLQAAQDSKERLMAIIFPDKSAIYFPGQITGVGETVAVDQAVTFSGTGQINGPVTYAPAPAGVGTFAAPEGEEIREAA